jgi:shikimate dehydrogenase
VSAPVKLAVLGFPLEFTLSPQLHRAGLEAIGTPAESVALPTLPVELGDRLAELAAAGWRGANLTRPLKEAALPLLGRISEAARRSRSVNTVGFGPEGWWGDTTDGAGFVDLLASLGHDPARERVMLFGGGAAARSLALALRASGCRSIAVSVRDERRARAAWEAISGVTIVAAGSRAEEDAVDGGGLTLVVNCTPLEEEWGPCPPAHLDRGILLIDLVYGPEPTAWVRAARALGLQAWDGLGLLVFQARRSLSLWAGREVPLEPLQRAVGWPR